MYFLILEVEGLKGQGSQLNWFLCHLISAQRANLELILLIDALENLRNLNSFWK